MNLDHLVKRVGESNAIPPLQSIQGKTVWNSVAKEARQFLVASLFIDQPVKILLVVRSHEQAVHWQAKLSLYGVPGDLIKLLPSGLSVLFEDASPETVALSDRLGSLRMLAGDDPCIVIATAPAALERTLDTASLQDGYILFEPGESLDVMDIVDRLEMLGYESSEPVRLPGQYSRRGGILDVFPMGSDEPIRAEFFGDEIESLRIFDPVSQRSSRDLENFEVGITRETMIPPKGHDLGETLERTLALESTQLGEEAVKNLEGYIEADSKLLEDGVYFDRLDLYRPLIQPDGGCALDLLGENGVLILDEPLEIVSSADRSEEELRQALDARHSRGEIISSVPQDFVWSSYHFDDIERTLVLSSLNSVPDWFTADETIEMGFETLQQIAHDPVGMTEAIKGWIKEKLCVVLATDQPMRAKSVLSQVEIFPTEFEGEHPLDQKSEKLPEGFFILNHNPAGGFLAKNRGLVLITDQELFGVARLKLPQRKFSEGVPISTVMELKPGDFVVHINYGIGIYRGLVRKEVAGVEKEFLHIEYKQPDQLFVASDQLDRIQKYVSPGDAPPKINRLSGGEWKKAVGKARADAREFARELIQIYAKRKEVERESFGEDSAWQMEMEGTFPYMETPSQALAIAEVKKDLQKNWPMDRLICGDVGFGKTEVAIRAAFKVADAGKQVAFLCPTTILSEQHFRSFQERLSGFSIKIALLNRFVSGKERKEVLEGLEKGEVDIVIGTHALLSNELKFKELGLLIIDEEQKFGVKHKETLKKVRVNVDVLTLSATPIPRTLSMSMLNIRQMSLINDPIPGRLPVRTHVRPSGDEVVKEAILRELARGGQVFYVYNRVQGINHIAERIRNLVPTARVAVGHGQMTEQQLEPVMVGFVKGEIDVLVSTTIVESGLDIPNANTLIVENADMFGLSQLYQLRGRVGRSDRQAYCYLMYKGDKSLTEGAEDRLRALAELTQLGSGYSLAFRDLQIRGAGDLLGAKQSGQMTSVGYDLYTQLIESEVKYLKTFADGERPDALGDPLEGLEALPTFDLPVKALIPEHYISDEGQRLYYYKLMMTSRDHDRLIEVADEIEDRYGKIPLEVSNALSIMNVRLKAQAMHVKAVDERNGRLLARFYGDEPFHPRLQSLLKENNQRVEVRAIEIAWPYSGDVVIASHEFMNSLASAFEKLESAQEEVSAFKG